MDIICAKSGRHFSSYEALQDCRESCSSGKCPYVKNETTSNNLYQSGNPKSRYPDEPISNPSPEEIARIEKMYGHDKNQKRSESTSFDEQNPKKEVVTPPESNDFEKCPSEHDLAGKEKLENTPKTFPIDPNIHMGYSGAKQTNKSGDVIKIRQPIPNWLIPLILIFALSIIGITINIITGSLIPFWILFGFSIIFSIEKWFIYYTRKYKGIGKLYRLLLNLGILSLLWLLVWSCIKLFSHQLTFSFLIGSLIFIAEFVFFIWLWKVVSKNRWRWPSMKLTIFSLILLFVIFAYAGVSPFVGVKDEVFNSMSSWSSNLNNQKPTNSSQSSFLTTGTDTPGQSQTQTLVIPTPTTYRLPTATPIRLPPVTPIEIKPVGINSKTGTYNNHFLGLVKSPEGVIGGDCYGEFIILINNKNAKNPTYSDLLTFLKTDKTDQFPYKYTSSVFGSYYGEAEDKIDLSRIKNIIDGVSQPSSPSICADFAERLHNNAEKAGIRCAYVSLDMVGYSDPYKLGIASDAGHACNAFETTDKGLVYIDCTGDIDSDGPENKDMIVNVGINKDYIPKYVFPSGGWTIENMGTVTNIFIAWDGEWR